uniref:RHS repeat-associated core domain-containing protein n=1 Tax=Escherichia coli TaxID=562 RepID=UPI001D0C5E05
EENPHQLQQLIRLPGQQYDEESGLYYNRHRYYDPLQGRYHYDSQHRLVHYTRTQYAEPLVESRYLYDPLGRRVAKRVWRRERDLTGWMSLSRKPQVTWYGWDGDRLTTIQNDRS